MGTYEFRKLLVARCDGSSTSYRNVEKDGHLHDFYISFAFLDHL